MGKTRQVGKYQLGRTVGEGTFAKVKFARNSENGESAAIKILAKSTILRHKMVDQIKREISIMKIVRHPNIVALHEVLASKTKIYIVLEFVAGGALFDKIVHQGRLSEEECRTFFQQLIDAIAHCHSKGPENLLLDSHERLKVSDFGLSALHQQSDGLLHTTCGTPNYIAPEVLAKQGYIGAAADVWSCGIILFVLMSGYLPFDETDLPTLYKKINDAEFSCPFWFSPGATSLIQKILDPNPKTEEYVAERSESREGGPLLMNAFEMITLSQGLNLSPLFDRQQDYVKRQTRFVSRKPARTIISSIEAIAESMGLKVNTCNFKTRIEGLSLNKASKFAVVLESPPSLFMIDVRKAVGETLEYHKFYKNLCSKLESIIWKPVEGVNPGFMRTMSC
ncbi:hypothetical protein MLD38_017074 [Melastoma candidum]|uniref:Uncharacterized protein n=1 Tax=Melastoma candidum TaxID=119954 RepID=A0ACB9QXN8_9MYRT|nr:hypothetical protein MLD38_017074 [Melastoma candidum]